MAGQPTRCRHHGAGLPLPSLVMWGPELVQVYFDAYRPFLGLRHPVALGQSTRDCWPEVWEFNQPIFCQVMDAGKPVHLQDQEFTIEPSGMPETRYSTATYAPCAMKSARFAAYR